MYSRNPGSLTNPCNFPACTSGDILFKPKVHPRTKTTSCCQQEINHHVLRCCSLAVLGIMSEVRSLDSFFSSFWGTICSVAGSGGSEKLPDFLPWPNSVPEAKVAVGNHPASQLPCLRQVQKHTFEVSGSRPGCELACACLYGIYTADSRHSGTGRWSGEFIFAVSSDVSSCSNTLSEAQIMGLLGMSGIIVTWQNDWACRHERMCVC